MKRYFANAILDFLFPPFCKHCGEKCSTKVLCQDCWFLCSLPDPIFRCRHCFVELENDDFLCSSCKKDKLLPIPRAFVFDPESPAKFLGTEDHEALASFAFLQWIQLEWDLPDAIIPMSDSSEIALAFAKIIDRPFIKALTSLHTYKNERLEEDQILLLFDVSSEMDALQKSARALAESFPKSIYLLSLFPC